jgi:glycosyltransferase involved in cell wall biosynthesis
MDSIFVQTFQDFEIIVVDDGSTDNGPEIVNQYKDPRVRIIHQSNAGPGAARNTGVMNSSSPYVAFLDADDEWLPNFLESSIGNLRANPDCVLSVANHYRGSRKILATTVPPFNVGIVPGPWRLPQEIEMKEMWGAFFYIQTPIVVSMRDVILEFGGFYEHRCNYMEDQYLWLQVLLKYKIFRDVAPLYWYHTENSELASNRKLSIPLLPFLADPDLIRKNCPAEYRATLERFLSYVAALNFPIMIWQNNLDAAKYLQKQYPMMKDFSGFSIWSNIIKLKIKIALPWLIPYVRTFKHFILRVFRRWASSDSFLSN